MNSHIYYPTTAANDQRVQIVNVPIEANGHKWWVTGRAWRNGTVVTVKLNHWHGSVNHPDDLAEALQNLAMEIGEGMDRRAAEPAGGGKRGRPRKSAGA